MSCAIPNITYSYKDIQLPAVSKINEEQRKQNMMTVINRLMSSGLPNMTIEIACGIAGNIKAESEFNYTVINKNGGAYGLCQWYQTRIEKLYDYCKSTNTSPNTIDGQIKYLIHELNTSYKNVYNTISSNEYRHDIDKVAYYFCMYFEIPGESACQNRASKARQVYSEYNNLKG